MESDRFLENGETFATFFNSVVEHIFKNRALFASMEDSIVDLIGSFHDIKVLHKIADNFAKKRDNVSAEGIYKRILEIQPDDDKATRKLAHTTAITDPNAINESHLPPIQLIEDTETLRAIETNFMLYKKANTSRPTSTIISNL